MKQINLLIASIVLINVCADAQDNFIDRFTLRKSFQSINDKAEPATITFTKPKDSNASWLLNAAIGFDILKNSHLVMTLDPYVEYQLNTLIGKKQDNFQTGLAFEWQTRDMSTAISWSPILIASEKYNDDHTKKTTSLKGNLYFTPLFKGKGLKFRYFWVPNIAVNLGRLLQFTYSPYVGLEHENRIIAAGDSALGNIYRYFARATANITLFPQNKMLKDKFEFNIDYQYRYDFDKSVKSIIGNEHSIFNAGYNCTLFSSDDKKKNVKIGIDYVNGEDPTVNFEKQSYYAIALKVKL